MSIFTHSGKFTYEIHVHDDFISVELYIDDDFFAEEIFYDYDEADHYGNDWVLNGVNW